MVSWTFLWLALARHVGITQCDVMCVVTCVIWKRKSEKQLLSQNAFHPSLSECLKLTSNLVSNLFYYRSLQESREIPHANFWWSYSETCTCVLKEIYQFLSWFMSALHIANTFYFPVHFNHSVFASFCLIWSSRKQRAENNK